MKKYTTLLMLLCSSMLCKAQFGKDLLNSVKNKAKATAEQKAVDKTMNVVDTVVQKTEKLLKGKKNKKEKVVADNAVNAENITADITSNNNTELVFQTNIKTAADKTKMEKILFELDGINSVTIDADTGITYCNTNAADMSNVIITAIKKNGFNAKLKK